MKKMLLLAAVCFGLCVLAHAAERTAPKGHPDSSNWQPLFKADLSDAVFPKGVWTVSDGVLTASKDEAIWTAKPYENFTLDLEFKNESGTNSGV